MEFPGSGILPKSPGSPRPAAATAAGITGMHVSNPGMVWQLVIPELKGIKISQRMLIQAIRNRGSGKQGAHARKTHSGTACQIYTILNQSYKNFPVSGKTLLYSNESAYRSRPSRQSYGTGPVGSFLLNCFGLVWLVWKSAPGTHILKGRIHFIPCKAGSSQGLILAAKH